MKVTIAAIFVLCAIGAHARNSERIPNRIGGRGEPRGGDKSWMSLCKCADSAVRKMQNVLKAYATRVSEESVKKSNKNYRPPALNAVLEEVQEIANSCTRRPDCRCPEGYFKTKDGTHCLKISEEKTTCRQASKICADSMNSRLAVAKNAAKLTKLSDYLRDIDPHDESHYWIGLSYNRTEAGLPVWTWEDGTKASYDITKHLDNNLKKSLLSITGLDSENEVYERVAINKDYEGTHYKQESCVDGRRNTVKHKYICEFVMFKVHVKAHSSQGEPTRVRAGLVRG